VKQAVVSLSVSTRRGLVDVTAEVRKAVRAQGLTTGLCTVFIQHTSASLVIQENADPAVQRDLERFLSRLVPEGEQQSPSERDSLARARGGPGGRDASAPPLRL
jgi:secondary thiamine-phosphate synthase enzyme